MRWLLLCLLVSCAGNPEEAKKPLGANRQQATIQEGRDNISNPAVPANELPPPGTPVIIPPVQP